MEKVLKYAPPALFLAVLLVFFIWSRYQVASLDQETDLQGVRVQAVVTATHFARGQSMDLEYLYKDERYYFYSANTPKFQVVPGDSVSLLIPPNQPDKWVLLENKIYATPRESYLGQR